MTSDAFDQEIEAEFADYVDKVFKNSDSEQHLWTRATRRFDLDEAVHDFGAVNDP